MISALLLASLSAATTIPTPADFAVRIPIRTEGSSSVWQVELDADVYQWSVDPALRDLAVFNAAGQPTPLMPWTPQASATIENQEGELPIFPLPAPAIAQAGEDWHLHITRDAEGRLRSLDTGSNAAPPQPGSTRTWLLDASAFTHGIDQLSLHWDMPETDVLARFRIEGSNDLEHWSPLRDGASVTLLERNGAVIDSRSIELDPGRKYRYLRLTRIDAGAELESLAVNARLRTRHFDDGVTLHWLNAGSKAQLNDLAASPTRFLYALDGSIPIDALKIELAGQMSAANLRISSRAMGAANTPWRELGALSAYRLEEGGQVLTHGVMHFGTGPRQQWLKIESGTPLAQAPTVSVGFYPQSIVFMAEGEGPYTLAVGSATRRNTDSPLDPVITRLQRQFGPEWRPPQARLGAVQAVTGKAALAAPEKPTDWKTFVLWAVLIGAAAMIGGIALSLLRGAQRGAEHGQQPPEQ